jgi:hypothetical protein
MTPIDDQLDAATEIDRLRAENARLREVGQAVVECHSMLDMLGFRRAIDALRAALKEGGGA